MRFSFKAKSVAGQELVGERDALDRLSLARDLRSEGFVLIIATEIGQEKKSWFKKITFSRSLGRGVSLREKILFVNNLGAMVGAGLPLTRALGAIERQTKNKRFKPVLTVIGEKIAKGESLSRSLGNFPDIFPEIFTAMIGVAEESGKLPETLQTLGEQLSKSYDLRRKVKGAMIYPAVIVTAIIVVGILMLVFLIPTLAATFKELGVALPLSTRLVIGTSDFLGNHYLIFVLGVAILGLVGFKYSRTANGSRLIDRLILKLPMIGNLNRQYNSATIMRTTASLISAGVSLVQSLAIAKKVTGNVFYREAIAAAEEKVQKGVTLASIFGEREDLFPVFVTEMTSVGEETGKLPEMLLKGAVFYEAEVDQATKNLSTIIEPVLMIFIGIAVGFFAVSMLGPMYSLSGAIK